MRIKFYVSLCAFVVTFFLVERASAQMRQATIDQIKLLLQEKESRTPAQRKIGSQLLQASREQRGDRMVAGVDLLKADVRATAAGMVKVDMTADVSDGLLQKITSEGGEILFPSKQYHTIRAMVPLSKVETIASFPEVKTIDAAVLSRTVGNPQHALKKGGNFSISTQKNIPSIVQKRRSMPERIAKVKQAIDQYLMVLGSGSASSQGDAAHGADKARNTYGYAGQGIKIGVLSDSYNSLGGAPADVLSDDLPGVGNPFGNTTPVTVLQDFLNSTGEDEGRAMLQIIHDLAPKAQLFFATGNVSEAGFATNIKALRDAGCDIVIDDLGYYDEPVFQDGIVAQAVKYVTDGGGMYFSSAGNEGNIALGTSGVWEGDFTDAGSPAITGTITGISKGGTIHNFGTLASPRIGDTVLTIASGAYNLQWADPWGASANDYDLFMISAAGAVKYSSTTTQSGTQNPYESFAPGTLASGDRLVVFKSASAAVRAISLNTNRGTLKIATTGQTHGHSAIIDAYCVAATPAAAQFGAPTPVGPYPGPFTSSNQVENFSSDGPRRMFYNVDGTPMVAGSNFTFAGGKFNTRLKPDITAADGVATTLPGSTGLNPFYGTSAAAPHAGAIAALIKSAKPSLTPAQIRTILTTTALDIQTPGYDNVSGYGILQAFQAMQNLNPTPAPYIALGNTTFSEGSYSNSNGSIEPGEVGNLLLQLTNATPTSATNVTATVTSATAGVVVTKGTFNYGTIAGNGNATNTGVPFTFAVNQSVACGTTVSFQVLVTFGGGGPSPVGFTITTTVGTLNTVATISALLGTPATGGSYTSATGNQTGRESRGGVTATCAAPVANPGLTVTTGLRRYDAYTFTNPSAVSQCFTATLNSANGGSLFTVAYTSAGFVPANPSTNYLAEPGGSATSQQYSFNVAAGAKFTVVVHAVDSLTYVGGNEIGSPYTLSLTYISCSVPPSCTPVSITTASIATGATGTYYVQHFAGTGGSGVYIDSVFGGLPAGLSFAGDSLYGTPTQAGSFAISVKLTDPAGCPSASMAYKLFIAGDSATSVTATAGTPQTAIPGQAFTTALQATVKNISNAPLSGVNVIFTAPSTGASGTFAGGVTSVIVVTNASGVATAPIFTSNTTLGSYTVTATVNNVAPASFSLSNACPSTLVTTGADSGPGSLRFIVANACVGATITFDPSVTAVNLTTGEIPINQSVTINGNGANVTSVSGGGLSRIFLINATTTSAVSINGLTIKNGKPQATGVGSANSGNGGGGILITAGNTVVVNGCYFLNNDASLTDLGEGGGIDNEGGVTLTVTNSGFTNNIAPEDGGGIAQWSTKVGTFSNCTFSGNSSLSDQSKPNQVDGLGGGLLISNSTGAGTAGGATVTNCTFSGNTSVYGGNIFKYAGTFRLGSTIIAGGIVTSGSTTTGRDIFVNTGSITSNGYNVVQYTGGFTLAAANNSIGVDPKLLPLANYGGIMPTILPMSSSVAVNGGIPTAPTLTVDQRGFPRVIGGRADMGAVETNYAATIAAGTPQATSIGTAFPTALAATVTESGNLIAGDSVLFGAPATGASGTFANGLKTTTVVTNASGVATATTFTANGTVGTYNDTASIGGTFTSLKYALTNKIATIAFTGCPNLNFVIARPGYNVYNNEPLSIYALDTITGAATLLPGGPLKDFALNRNIEVNGTGVNMQDGFIYGIRDTINTAGTAATAMLYRIGTNYGNDMIGTLPVSPLLPGENLAVVIPSAGTFDDLGNYYYVAMSGGYSFTGGTFTPSSYYIGKIANVSALPVGNGALTPTWTKVNFTGAPNSFTAGIFKAISSASGTTAGTGFQDITYSNLYKSFYVYSAYNNGSAYAGQLFAINPTTGATSFYANPPAFGASNNEVAGISTTASGNLRVFTTSGDIYKPVMAGNGDFSSTLTKIGTTGITPLGITGSIRGDLASCATGANTLPLLRPAAAIVIGLPNQIVAFPNPAQGLTTITVGLPLSNATVRLLEATGNVITERSGVSGYTFQIDMSGKAGGMYTVEVIQGGNTQVAKIIKP